MKTTSAVIGTLLSLYGAHASALTLACDPTTVEIKDVGAITVSIHGGYIKSASNLVGAQTQVVSSILLGQARNYPAIESSSVKVLKAYKSYSVNNLQYYSTKLSIPVGGVDTAVTAWTNCALVNNEGSL
jgi:hypothetical protein